MSGAPRCTYNWQAQLKKLEAGLSASPLFYASRRATATADHPPGGIERKFGSPRLTKRVHRAGWAGSCFVSVRALRTYEHDFASSAVPYGVSQTIAAILGPPRLCTLSNQLSCSNLIDCRKAPLPLARISRRHRADAAPVPTMNLTRPAPAGSPRRASSRPRAPGPPRRASPPRGRSRRSPRSSRCGRTASSCRSSLRPWSGSLTRRRRSTSSRSRPSSWRSPASSRPRRGRGLPLSAKTGIVYCASLPPRTSGAV